MGHIRYASDVGAPVEVAFSYADNHLFVPDWLFGTAAFDPVGTIGHGVGAVYAATLGLGLWHPTVEWEITEYRRNAVLGFTLRRRRPGRATPAHSETQAEPAIGESATSGTDSADLAVLGSFTLRFDPLGYGRSVLTSEADYRPARGIFGRLGDAVTDSAVHCAVRRSETRLRREIEEFHGTDLVGRIA